MMAQGLPREREQDYQLEQEQVVRRAEDKKTGWNNLSEDRMTQWIILSADEHPKHGPIPISYPKELRYHYKWTAQPNHRRTTPES